MTREQLMAAIALREQIKGLARHAHGGASNAEDMEAYELEQADTRLAAILTERAR